MNDFRDILHRRIMGFLVGAGYRVRKDPEGNIVVSIGQRSSCSIKIEDLEDGEVPA